MDTELKGAEEVNGPVTNRPTLLELSGIVGMGGMAGMAGMAGTALLRQLAMLLMGPGAERGASTFAACGNSARRVRPGTIGKAPR